MLAWIVFLVAVPVWAWGKIAKVDAEPDGARPPDQPGTTYLLVGSDSLDPAALGAVANEMYESV